MIQEVYEIGKLKTNSKNSKIDDSIMPDKLTKIAKLFCLNFDDNYKFINVDIHEFNEEEQYLYLMRKGASNGINYGPTSQITEIHKTLKNKIISWFKEVSNDIEIAKNMETELEHNEGKIVEYINRTINKKEKCLITVCINNQFPYEVKWIFEAYENMIKKKVFGNEGNIGTCYLCNKKEVAIVPEYGVYKFFTKDKPGFISGGFQENDFWRNFPICVNCQPILNKGKQFIELNLKYKYYGLNYCIIPSSIKNDGSLKEIIEILESNGSKIHNLSKESITEFEIDNEAILYKLRDSKDINSFRLLFIEKANAAERILLDIKDVYPSRFKQMYNAKDKIDREYKDLLKFVDKNKNIIQPKFNFSFYREFLSKSDDKNRDNDLNKIFLELTQTIFNTNKIRIDILLPHYMRKIRRLVEAEDESYKLKNTILKAIMGIQYLILVNCLDYRKDKVMETKYNEFFEKYNCGLDTDIKRALLLVGTLVQKVMNIQYSEIKSTPFIKNLKSLRMRENDVKGIIAQCINKMQEYDCYSNKSKEIVQEISKLIFSTNTDWKLSVDEINFYIAAGMALQKEIYGNDENIKEEK